MTSERKGRLVIQCIFVVLAGFSMANAGGEVDPTFSAAAYGELTNGSVQVVKRQPDAKILIGGQFTEVHGAPFTGLARLNSDGTLDTSFTPPNFVSTAGLGAVIYAMAVQPDGKIIVAGQIFGVGDSRRGIRRLNADGSIDTSFFVEFIDADSGPLGNGVFDVELLPDGKILLGGALILNDGAGFRRVVRLNADGTRDGTFQLVSQSEFVQIKDIEVLPDGKIVAGGGAGIATNRMQRLFRHNADGTADASFTTIGSGNGQIEALESQADGKILIGGSFTTVRGISKPGIARLNTDGSLDATFNSGGSGANGAVNDIGFQDGGKIIAGGSFSTFNGTAMQRIARLNSDGVLDVTFANNAMINEPVLNDVEVFPDNVILAGFNNSAQANGVTRFSADGVVDGSFVVLVSRGGIVTKILQQPDGKILAAGYFNFANGQERRALARFHPDGTLDTTFVPYFNNHSPLPILNALVLQPDGKILVGATNGIVLQRLNADGSRDAGFNQGLPSSSQVFDIAVMPDGKIVAGGVMTSSRPTLARFNSDGSVDNSFNPAQPNDSVRRVVLLADGKILVSGRFQTIADIATRNGLARFNADGTLDGTFVPPLTANTYVYDLDIQPDGRIVHTMFLSNRIRRLNADGSLDASLPQLQANTEIDSIKVQPDGKILIAGGFSVIGGTAKNGIARLHANGMLDSSFTTYSNSQVFELAFQTDGKLLIGGRFTAINGLRNDRIARLINTSVPEATLYDYDGDGRADISVFRPSENRWYVFRSLDSTVMQTVFAIAGDVPVPADYDGDHKTDVAIYRPSNGAWWYLSSINGAQINVNWGGEAGDVPRPGDFDVDGKADFIIFRPTNNFWYRISSGNGAVSNILFGAAGDKPVRGDFDGDGNVDPAIFRPSTGDWWYRSSLSHNQLAVRWGISTDIPAPADFDGDGKTDFAVFRPSTGVWYVINSSNGSFLIGPFGTPEDKPVPADYDGDGKAELAVFRPSSGIWYQLRTNGGFFAMQFGVSTDTPTPNAFVP